MRTESYEIVIPEKARVMTEEEMEYEGQFAWWPISAALSAVGWACTLIGKATNNKDLRNVGTVITVVGIASTGIGIVAGAATAVSTTAMTTAQAADFAYNCSIGVADGILGISSNYW